MSSLLLVDDNVDLVENLKEILELEGHDVVAATAVDRGLVELEQARFDLIITDMRMPGLDGTDLVREARERWPETPVVPMSAFADDGLVERAHKYGAIGLIAKPINIAKLCEIVDTLTKSGRRVLIVEQDENEGASMVELASELGNVVPLWVSDLAHARRVIEELNLSAAVIDRNIPNGEGQEIERCIAKRFGEGFGVVYVSGTPLDAGDVGVENCKSCGLSFNSITVARPFEPFEFVSALRKVKA